MADEGFFARLTNLIKGMFGSWIGKKEERNPEAVYEAAIQERIEQYDKLKKAVAGIVYLRNKLASELEQKGNDLKKIQEEIVLAVDKGEDEVALHLIQKKDDLDADVGRLKGEMEHTAEEAEEAKRSLVDFQSEIERLHRDGLLTDEEYRRARRAALGLPPLEANQAGGQEAGDAAPEGPQRDDRETA